MYNYIVNIMSESNNMEISQPAKLKLKQLIYPEDVSNNVWRPIHYLGSKLRVLNVVEQAINDVSPQGSSVCDLFSGSGTVSSSLARTRPVTAVDIQEYSKVICAALLHPVELPTEEIEKRLKYYLTASRVSGVIEAATALIELEEAFLERARTGDLDGLASLIDAGPILTSNKVSTNEEIKRAFLDCKKQINDNLGGDNKSNMVLRHFGGSYFSFKQAAELDVILEMASKMPETIKTVMIAAALSTASELVNTVGKQFAQPIRPRDKDGNVKKSLYSQAARDRYKSTFDIYFGCLKKFSKTQTSLFNHKAIKADYYDYLSSSKFNESVVYADPPYTRDHYSRFYHVLETLALRDDPNISTNTAHGKTLPSRGIYRTNRHQSPFCIRSKAPVAFERLFSKVAARKVPLVLSYSPYASDKNAHPRVMQIDSLRKIAKQYFNVVDIETIRQFSHSKLNKIELHKEVSQDAEYLFICR